MKKILAVVISVFIFGCLKAGTVEKTYFFGNYTINNTGRFQVFNFRDTRLSGFPGEPLLPWQKVVLMLPAGEEAVSVEITREGEVAVPGKFFLQPAQQVLPLSRPDSGSFSFSEQAYGDAGAWPAGVTGKLMTQYLNGFSFAMTTFTPVNYFPKAQKLSYFSRVTIRIHTQSSPNAQKALAFFSGSEKNGVLARQLAQNPEMAGRYPGGKSPATNYEYLIISPVPFKNEFQPLISMYSGMGISARVIGTDSISSAMTGIDLQEKIRNFIISQRQDHGIGYVLLAGNPALIPCRGFYCYVMSGGTPYTDSNIPADLYYSGLDGNFDANGNHIYGELADAADLLPEISVGRFPVNDTAELHHMIRKTISYQTNPVLGEFSRPLLAGEYLYNNPVTFGSDYMDLLIDDHNDNGYFTHGIPSSANHIGTLYDSIITPPLTIWQWTSSVLLARINQGNSFIHHLGHANTTYMLRLSMGAVTNANFASVNGITHNYQLLYTQGCYDGAFDDIGGCIAAKAVTIDNFLVAGIFNSRYGWFNQGTTDGPSQHLEREFVSALYDPSLPEKHLGTAHMISKIETAPWVSLPGEFEPGAQLWCHYCCNVFGDPALEIRTSEPTSFTNITWTGNIDSDWKNPGNWNLALVPTTLFDVIIPDSPHDPVITTNNATFCHNLTILNGATLTINPGKSMVVYGTVSME